MNQDKWAERLDRHLADYRKEPKRDLWEGIEASLDKKARRQAHLVSMRRWMAAAAILGVISGGALLFWPQPNEMVQGGRENRPLAQTRPVVSGKHDQETPPQKSEPQESLAQAPDRVTACNHTASSQESPEVTLMTEQDKQPTVEMPQEEEQKEEPAVARHEEPLPPAVRHQPYQPVLIGERNRNYQRQLALSLYASGGTSSWEGRNGVQMSPSMLQQFSASRAESPVWLVNYEERQSHAWPVSFGLTLSYPLNSRLSVCTGVVYTRLSSDFLTIMQQDQIRRHQILYYLGVPLNLQFSLWQWHGLGAYLSAGGQADWNIKAEANTDGVDQVMSKDRLQWSVGGSLGVQYNVIPQLGIYVEPGIRHYFDNGSSVSNYFKDKPTTFNLQLGIRFHP